MNALQDNSPRIALCLSGGGFRAALFHLGALRRLNELGALSQVDTIISVSGGSILSAHLATHLSPWVSAGSVFDHWEDRVEKPIRAFVKRNIRNSPVLKRYLLPWNWPRPRTQIDALEATYHEHLTKAILADLPDHPNFIYCSTDMTNGVDWVFEKKRVGSFAAGYVMPAPRWPLARAVAASSCFPPVFDPLPVEVPSDSQVTDGLGRAMKPWEGMSLSDGGLYDNMGLQPAENISTVLVSDGGLPFIASTHKDLFARWKAYLEISDKQAGAIRRRMLIERLDKKEKHGTYWGIGSAVSRYQADAKPGYSKELATSVISRVRTDMDVFSDAEIAVLENHGYLLADIALHVHAKELIAKPTPAQVPHPDWLDEARVRKELATSHERWWFGRY